MNASPRRATALAFDSRAFSGRLAGALNDAVVTGSTGANGPPCRRDSSMIAAAMSESRFGLEIARQALTAARDEIAAARARGDFNFSAHGAAEFGEPKALSEAE